MMEEKLDLPAAFRAADLSSQTAQRWHVGLVVIHLAVLVAAAVAGVPTLQSPANKADQNTVIAVLLVVGALLSLYTKVRPYDRIWYRARARAESIKSMAWKYAMRAEPYALGDAESEATLCNDLFEHREEAKWSHLAVGALEGSSGVITPSMRALRGRPWNERLDVYTRLRVSDQRAWYAKRATEHQRADTVAFVALIAVQVGFIALALVRIGTPDFPSAIVGVFSATSSGIIAWTALRRYGELVEAYTAAAHDLDLVATRASGVKDDVSLAAWVSDTENAISREHTSWRARREVK